MASITAVPDGVLARTVVLIILSLPSMQQDTAITRARHWLSHQAKTADLFPVWSKHARCCFMPEPGKVWGCPVALWPWSLPAVSWALSGDPLCNPNPAWPWPHLTCESWQRIIQSPYMAYLQLKRNLHKSQWKKRMLVVYVVNKKPRIMRLAECLSVFCSICRKSQSLEFPPHLILTSWSCPKCLSHNKVTLAKQFSWFH